MDKTYFTEMKAMIKEFRQKMKDEGEKFFLDASKELFEKHPSLVGFGWKQYTPYYNDGDECVFSARMDYPDIQLEGDEEPRDGEDLWFDAEDNSEEHRIHTSVQEFLKQFDDDDVREMFGDHIQVWVTKDLVEIEEYSHD